MQAPTQKINPPCLAKGADSDAVNRGVNLGDAVNGGILCLYLLPWTRRESPWLKMSKPLLFKLMLNLRLSLSLSLYHSLSLSLSPQQQQHEQRYAALLCSLCYAA